MVYCFYDIATNEKTKCSKTDFDSRFKALKTNEVLFLIAKTFIYITAKMQMKFTF